MNAVREPMMIAGRLVLSGFVAFSLAACSGGGPTSPDPGPIIDIVVGPGGDVTYEKDNSEITLENSSYEIDPDFLNRLSLAQFLDRDDTRVVAWRNNNYVTGTFDDGGSLKFTLKGNKLEFKCTPAGGSEHTITAGADSSVGIPDCMKGTFSPTSFSYTESGVSIEGDWLHLETEI